MDQTEKAFYREMASAGGEIISNYLIHFLLYFAIALLGAYVAFRYIEQARAERLSHFEEYAEGKEELWEK